MKVESDSTVIAPLSDRTMPAPLVEDLTVEEYQVRREVDLDMLLTNHPDARGIPQHRVRAAIAYHEERAIRLVEEVQNARRDYLAGHDRHERSLVSFEAADVAVGESRKLVVQLAHPFKPVRLLVDEACAEGFLIKAVVIGVRMQLLNPTPATASLFTPAYHLIDLDMDTVQTMQNFAIEVQNVSAAPRWFRASVFGLLWRSR